MKLACQFCIVLILYSMLPGRSRAQSLDANRAYSPRTILWKITGDSCPKPSYLLGTFHLSDAEWLLETLQMKQVIDSTEYILNEALTTQPVSPKPKKEILKALPLLDARQFRTLDSFFVARVGEGIRNNRDAEAMTIAEMEVAILGTLLSGSDKANGITKFMDKDLFDLYVSLGRQGDQLDRLKITDFDSSEIDRARQYLARVVNYTIGSDKPGWNVYRMTNVEDALKRYKNIAFEYHFDEHSPTQKDPLYADVLSLEQRNRDWMPKILAAISSKPTLIAVGLAHLDYRTGLVMLLRVQGYRVEPVMFH